MASRRQRTRHQARRHHHATQTFTVPLIEHLRDIAKGRRSMPSSSTWYQHYLPQAHLRAFSPNPTPRQKARIWQLDKESGEAESRLIARTGGAGRFYSVHDADDKPSNEVEAWLSIVESHAGPALQRLRERRAQPDKADRVTLAFYIAVQEVRTPYGLTFMQRLEQWMLEAHVGVWTLDPHGFKKLAAEAGLDESAEHIEAARRDLRDASVRSQDPKLSALSAVLSAASDIAAEVCGLSWQLLESAQPLVCGDHPISHHDPVPPDLPWTHPAWQSTRASESFIPLGPHTGLMMTPGKRPFIRRTLSEAEAHDLNIQSYGWAMRQVHASDERTLNSVHAAVEQHPAGVPSPGHRYQAILADERAFLPWEPNEQPEGWPSHLLRPDGRGGWQRCRYRVARQDRPKEVRAAAEWSTRAEQRLHPGERPLGLTNVGGADVHAVRPLRGR
jgi:hypothetical protein